MNLAAAGGGAAFGELGAGGIALAATVLLILGVKGQGRVKLKDNPALIVAFIAGTTFTAAGKIWTNPEKITKQGLAGIGVGHNSGVFGHVGIGAVCLILLILMLCWKLTPFRGAVLGLIAAFVWPLAGSEAVWSLPVQLALAVPTMLGG
ncbi:hypothetical protein [Streptomyces sioyaensis]|uniref:hypothetical protein n=1 Tax=Streptomyces sioyaensis TaxID=67364 RepID=UPI0037AB7366